MSTLTNKHTAKKWETIDKILLGLAIFLGLFIIANLVIFCIFQSIPDALVTSVLGGSAIEMIITYKLTKNKHDREAVDE